MKRIQHEEITKASSTQLWKVYQDVSNWKAWDHEIEESFLNGEFKVGSKGMLKPKGGPKTWFRLMEVRDKELFSDLTNLPLCKLEFRHELFSTNSGTKFVHTVTFSGPLSFLFSRVIGNKIRKELPGAMKNLAKLAEDRLT
ncbi:polyketide cyclase/dehydrase and lipid transport [Leptospira weilii]|uniref:polyketide cyclase/dehydrase and lipid transport n=1 Tax=Leptospira weilii TaxID=28184 RepID=UPI00201B709F|nr:polyketide cyclase/dehydrase and lipid transport [Leptospira weilii]UPY77158.1 polyketide cyclase/dehydrase and lipid transport [Leptospira weilii]